MTPRRRDDNFWSTRRSYFYYSEPGSELYERIGNAVSVEGLYTYMLYQDLDIVVPYSLGREQGVAVRLLSSEEDRVLPLVAGALSERTFPDLQGGVRKFFATVAQHLVFAESCTYEVEYLFARTASVESVPEEFRLQQVLAGTLGEHRGNPIQYVLPTISELQDRNGLHYVELDPEMLVTFTLPKDLVRPVRRMIRFLRLANSEQTREFALMEQAMRGPSDYVFSVHKRLQRDLFAEVTEPIGWNTRDLFKDDLLEPFNIWRQIRFLEFKIRLRELILEELNRVLAQVGRKMGFDASLEFHGLPTAETVQSLKEDFRSGARGFGDLVNALS